MLYRRTDLLEQAGLPSRGDLGGAQAAGRAVQEQVPTPLALAGLSSRLQLQRGNGLSMVNMPAEGKRPEQRGRQGRQPLNRGVCDRCSMVEEGIALVRLQLHGDRVAGGLLQGRCVLSHLAAPVRATTGISEGPRSRRGRCLLRKVCRGRRALASAAGTLSQRCIRRNQSRPRCP